MMASVIHRLRARSVAMLGRIEDSLTRMMFGWLALVALLSAARIATSPVEGGIAPSSLIAFFLLAAAPVVSGLMAMRWFAHAPLPRQIQTPLWRPLGPAEARRHPLYGAGGLMVSLLVGLLLNIAIRGLEYLAAMPALSGDVPAWLSTLQLGLTLDVVLFTSLYAIAFVAALKRAPVFPPLLMAIWVLDLLTQVGIAQLVFAQPDLPPSVGSALHSLTGGNINKVLISAALWLPYLLLSKRVNVTFRNRAPR